MSSSSPSSPMASGPDSHLVRLDSEPDHTRGVLSFFRPTHARYQVHGADAVVKDESPDSETSSTGAYFQWRSRDHRKGRHALVVTQSTSSPSSSQPRPTRRPSHILTILLRLFTTFPYSDISYLVSFTFVIGSIVWVINGFFVFLPLVQPSSTFPTEIAQGGGVSAFIGATIFFFGAWIYVLEVINEDLGGAPCFGWAVRSVEERIEDGVMRRLMLMPNPEGCKHRFHMFGEEGQNKASSNPAKTSRSSSPSNSDPSSPASTPSWTWLPSLPLLRTRFLYSIGFWASFIQAMGATIFWIAGFTALPWVLDSTTRHRLADGVFWTPQVVGGMGFIISGFMFMLETQKHWWKPEFGVLGWHIGFWNTVGGIGFTISGAFGFSTRSGLLYQSALSTFWGGWAFLIGSAIQWYESVDKHPVEVKNLKTTR